MKVLLLFLSFFTISHSALAGNGWSSSGGGEYIIDQNNPWFMGKEAVKWCIDHGGEDKFSLPLNLAKPQVEQAIANLASQLKSINDNESNFDLSPVNPKYHNRKCGVGKNKNQWNKECSDGLRISDKFIFVPNCNEADIEFILGNYKNSKIEKLITDIGLDQFKKLAGIAIRTEYSQETLRGKGFIYIAADKGAIQYSGERNIHIPNKTIWNNVEQISKKAPFPKNIVSTLWWEYIDRNLKFADYIVGALGPIITHEFGHTLGLEHNHFKNIMDEDYPAEVIKTGFAFKGNFLRDSKVLSSSLIESDLDRRLGFEWSRNFDQLNGEFIENLKENNPNIYDFMYAHIPREYEDQANQNIFLIMDFGLGLESTIGPKIQFLTLDNNDRDYKLLKTYKLSEVNICDYPVQVGSINLRITSTVDDITNWVFDSIANDWVATNKSSTSTTNTIPLITLDSVSYCGNISSLDSSDDEFLRFEIRHSYFQNTDELILYDGNDDLGTSIFLRQGTILGSPSEKLTKPEPLFYFKKYQK